MISLLEKEARDPADVLRVKLRDSTDASLLNSQLLQEIKHDYLAKQLSTRGQLDAFVQTHVDDIERASALLEVSDAVAHVTRTLAALGERCRRMNDELGEKRLSAGVSVARRNLRDLEHQIIFYNELPSKVRFVWWSITAKCECGDVAQTACVYCQYEPTSSRSCTRCWTAGSATSAPCTSSGRCLTTGDKRCSRRYENGDLPPTGSVSTRARRLGALASHTRVGE